MSNQAHDPIPNGTPLKDYLDLWNVVLVLLGITAVLLLRPYWL